jgi:phosphatidate cytidylyltransferase
MIGGDLLPRIASSVVLIAIAAAGTWLGGLWSAAVVAAVVAIVHLEWTGLSEGSPGGAAPFTAALVVAMLACGLGFPGGGAAIAGAAAAAAALTGGWPWRPAGVAYAGLLGLSLLVLRYAPDNGFEAIVFLLAVVWATDIGGFVAGRTIGGAKLWPRISPKKTWAGAVGGLIGSVAAGVAAAFALGLPVNAALVVVAIFLSISSQCGDLFESFVKRHFGAKDSGHIIPGHGGLMDRVDGLVFASVVAVAVGFVHNGAGNPAEGLVFW